MKSKKPLPKSILFVCLGNICRSPSAEEVFRNKFKELSFSIKVDSAGTAGYHQGEFSDPRTITTGKKRGYELKHRARKVIESDFEIFDLILCMDDSNLEHLMRLSPSQHKHKIQKLTDYSLTKSYDIVPDPYYGDQSDFDLVIDIAEECFQGFISFHQN